MFPLHTRARLVTPLFPLLTQKQGGAPSPKNVGAPTFLIFPIIFRTFLPRLRRAILTPRRRNGKRARMKACPACGRQAASRLRQAHLRYTEEGRVMRRHSPAGTCRWPPSSRPLSFTSHSTARLLLRALPKRNLGESRQVPGARPSGYVALIRIRCPDAHD